MIVEAILTFILVATLIYVSPGILSTVAVVTPVCATQTALVASRTTVSSIVVGGLNISAIVLIAMGIGILVMGFLIIRNHGDGR